MAHSGQIQNEGSSFGEISAPQFAGRRCDAVLPSVMPSTHLMASKYILRVTKRRVENAAFAIHLVPGHREIVIRAVHPRIVVVQFGRIETEKNVDLLARPVLRLINLVQLHKSMWKVVNRGKVWVFINDRRV